jgi:hypothetical protein
MKIGHTSGSRNQRRRRNARITPAAAELLETRSLLSAGPVVNTPMGTVTTDQPVISWDAVDQATGYDLELHNIDDGSTRVFLQEDLPDTNYTPDDTQKMAAGNYRAWVRAKFAEGEEPTVWSSPKDFSVRLTPRVLTPTGVVNSSRPEIIWEGVDEAVSYDVWVGDIDNNMMVFVEEGVASNTWIPTEAQSLSEGSYRVWVRGRFTDGTYTEWSPDQDFEVLFTPLVETPEDGGRVTTSQPEITWTPLDGAISYHVWVGNTGTSTREFLQEGITGNSYVPTLEQSLGTGDYRVEVRRVWQTMNSVNGVLRTTSRSSSLVHYGTWCR